MFGKISNLSSPSSSAYSYSYCYNSPLSNPKYLPRDSSYERRRRSINSYNSGQLRANQKKTALKVFRLKLKYSVICFVANSFNKIHGVKKFLKSEVGSIDFRSQTFLSDYGLLLFAGSRSIAARNYLFAINFCNFFMRYELIDFSATKWSTSFFKSHCLVWPELCKFVRRSSNRRMLLLSLISHLDTPHSLTPSTRLPIALRANTAAETRANRTNKVKEQSM